MTLAKVKGAHVSNVLMFWDSQKNANLISMKQLFTIMNKYFFPYQVKEVDLDTAIKCLSKNYKIFKDSGTGLEPVTLSIGDRMAGMIKVNERKAGYFKMLVML